MDSPQPQQPVFGSGTQGTMPSAPPPTPPHERYDFFLKDPQPTKRTIVPLGHGSSFGRSLLMLVGGAVAVFIVFALVLNIFFARKLDVKTLTQITQQQQEIARIADLAELNATSQDVQNLAVTSELATQTSQFQLLDYLTTKHHVIKTDTLQATQSKTTDSKLTSAQQTGNYNSVYLDTLDSQLASYQTKLSQVYKATKVTSLKKILQANYAAAGKLQAQIAPLKSKL